MIDQLIGLVKQYGQQTVIDNPDVPYEYNEEIVADATKTIGSGFQNLMAGGGFENILELFKGGSNSSGGTEGLLKNPIVNMMVGYFSKKLVSKYQMNPAKASNVSNQLIPSVLEGLISRTTSHAPENDAFDFNDLIGSLTGGNLATSESNKNGFNFQGLLDQFVGGGDTGGHLNIQDIVSQVTNGAQQNHEQEARGGGLMDLIGAFIGK